MRLPLEFLSHGKRMRRDESTSDDGRAVDFQSFFKAKSRSKVSYRMHGTTDGWLIFLMVN